MNDSSESSRFATLLVLGILGAIAGVYFVGFFFPKLDSLNIGYFGGAILVWVILTIVWVIQDIRN